jgi:hypothetical protein
MTLHLLIPHGAAFIAFVAAFAVMNTLGTNRSNTDKWLAIGGFALWVVALVATAFVLFTFPYRTARPLEWLTLAEHVLMAFVVLPGLSLLWIAYHLA